MAREGRLMIWVVLAALALVAALPTARLVWAALAPDGTFAPAAALARIAAPAALSATMTTLEIGIASALIALGVGGGVAVALAVTDVAGKRILALLFVWSLMIAPQVTALAFKTLLGPASPLLGMLGIAPAPGTPNPMLGKAGIVLVLGLHHAPLVAITLAAGLGAVPQSVIDAARLDGAGPLATLRHIVLPLLLPSLVAATLLALVAGIGNFGIPALLGIPAGVLTLPTLIYRQLTTIGPSVIPDAAAVSLIAAGLATVGSVLAAIALARVSVRLTREAPMAAFCRLGSARIAVSALLWTVVALTAVLPFLSLLATALVPAVGVKLTPATATLDAFAEVLLRQGLTVRALRNSFLLAFSAATLLAIGAMLVAYVLERHGGRWRTAVETVIELPFVVPGVVLAIACILLFLKPLPVIGVSLYATPFIILVAYLARFLPVALKPQRAAMAMIATDEEEAAAIDGARLADRLRHILLPALAPAAAAGGLLAFLLAFNELTVSALLWSAGTETLGVALLSLEDAGLVAEAAAVGVTTALIVAALMLVLDRLAAHLPEGALPWSELARVPPG